jgi:hypothetical protein
MRADTLVFDVEIFLERNLFILTPVDSAEAAAEAITHAIATPAAAATTTTTIATIVAIMTIAVAKRLEETSEQALGGAMERMRHTLTIMYKSSRKSSTVENLRLKDE